MNFDKSYQISGNKFDNNFWKYYFNVKHFDKIILFDNNFKQIELSFSNILIIRDGVYEIY
jgi:branched-subunit amino acid aminotransferase/4-amino-4-deoxychorismate lyase